VKGSAEWRGYDDNYFSSVFSSILDELLLEGLPLGLPLPFPFLSKESGLMIGFCSPLC
jgi:hypothetical protein